jgi:hypothetical protein
MVSMKWLPRLILAVSIFFALLTIFVAVILWDPDWSPFQPTVGTNIAIFATLCMVLATLFLAYTAAKTIESSTEQEKRRRKDALLNEIIEWAVDVLECETEVSLAPIQAGVTDQNVLRGFARLNLLFKYRSADARSEYMINIAQVFEKDLQSAVAKATGELAITLEFLSEHLETATTEEVRAQREDLERFTLAVIKEASKIKTKD